LPKTNTFIKVPENKAFKFQNGDSANSVGQLYKNIRGMKDKEFSRYCNDHKNEFYNWIFDVIQDIELSKEMLGCTSRKVMIDTMRSYFETITKPSTPKVLQKKKGRPTTQRITKKPESILNKVLNLRPKREYKQASASHRDTILKDLKEVYKIGR